MPALCLQDWVTIRGTAELSSISQAAGKWLDLGAYHDVVFFLDVKQVDPSTQINYETAPVQEESAFLPVVTTPILSVGVRSDTVLSLCAGIPLARYVRWNLTNPASSAWGITFRVWAMAYSLS